MPAALISVGASLDDMSKHVARVGFAFRRTGNDADMNEIVWDEGGADLHSWESQWASIAEDADSDPDAALSQYADLVEQVLGANGYAVRDAVAREGEEREIVTTYLAARETAERAELGAASRSEVEQAIEDLRSVFDTFFLSQAGLEPE